MAEDVSDARLDAGEAFTGAACANNDDENFDIDFDFDFGFGKCGRYVDKAKPMLGYSLEDRICSGLKEFVCDPNSRYSRRLPCVKKWLDYANAFLGKDSTAAVAEETVERATKYLAKGGPANSAAANTRVDGTCHRGPRADLADRNDSKNLDVRRYINEKDFWLSRSSANDGSIDALFGRKNEGPKGADRSSDLEVEVDSCSERVVERCAARLKRFAERGCGLESDARDWESLRAANTRDRARRRIERTSSKLKLLIYRTTYEDGSTALAPTKATSVSVPCRPSRLIVRIFEAVPSLSESCLIRTRRKFENGIRNACSRLNGLLKKLDDAEARELRLVCEIRPSCIDLTVRRPRTSKPRLFLARLPTRRSHPKRESCRGPTGNENSGNRREQLDYRGNSQAPLGRCPEEKQEHLVACRALGLPCDSTKATIRSSSQSPNSESSGDRTNFARLRKPENEVSFCFANPSEKRKASPPAGDSDERCCKSDATVSDRVDDRPCFDENGREAKDSQELVGKEANNVSNAELAENNVELRDSESSCYSDSLRKDEQTASREQRADIPGPRQRLWLDPREKDERNADGNEGCPRSGHGKPRRVVATSGRKSGLESRRPEKDTSNSMMEPKAETRRFGNSVFPMEKSNSTMATSNPTKEGAPMAERSAEIAEKLNVESVYSLNCSLKCSCCGVDLSDAERIDFESVRVTVSIESKTSSSKTEISVREVADEPSIESKSCPEPSKLETADNAAAGVHRIFSRPSASRPAIRRAPSIRDGSSGATALHGRPESWNEKAIYGGVRRPTEAEGDHERVGRTSVEQWSRRSNVSDPDSLAEDDCRERTTRPGSPRRRSSPRSKTKRTPTRFATRDSCSTQEVRATRATTKSRRRARNYSDRICNNRFCSFPAASLDRLKYLIRRKLRRLLLEERNKGTNTSKTYLNNERYFVSASSGKLNEGRAIRDSCLSECLGRRGRARAEPGSRQPPGETGGTDVSGRKRAYGDRAVGRRRRRITRRGLCERIKVTDLPRVFSPKRNWKFVGPSDPLGEGARQPTQKTVETNDDNSAKILLVEGTAWRILGQPSERKLADDKISNERSRNRRNEQFDGRLRGDSVSEENSTKSPRGDSRARESLDSTTSSSEGGRNEKSFRDASPEALGNTMRNSAGSRLFEGRRESKINCGDDFVILYTDYERYVNDICADFRLKLLQYVALCKSAKDTLSKRLRPDGRAIGSNST